MRSIALTKASTTGSINRRRGGSGTFSAGATTGAIARRPRCSFRSAEVLPVSKSLLAVPYGIVAPMSSAVNDSPGSTPANLNLPRPIAHYPRGCYACTMKTHQEIDRRSFVLAQAVAATVDRDPSLAGLARARRSCARWLRDAPSPAIAEWQALLQREWPEIRSILLDPGERGRRLRQSNPFCGVLSPRERWEIYRRFSREHQAV